MGISQKYIPVSFNGLLDLAREVKGLSLRDAAARAKVSNAYISQVENGKCMPSFEIAVRLCDVYGLKIETLANAVRRQGA